MLNRTSALAVVLALLLPTTASAQLIGPDDVVDRVVAVVGDSIVLQTEVSTEIQRMELAGAMIPDPADPAYPAFFRDLLDSFVDRLLVVQAAEQDTLLQPDEAGIDRQAAERIDGLALQLGGQLALQQALAVEGLTLAEFRDILRHDARQAQIYQSYLQDRLRGASPVEVTEDEMLARFQEASGGLEQRPRTLTFRQVVVKPEADESARERARAEAEELLTRVRAGEDFAELAREHSDDLGSATLGGDLGWFRRGQMVAEFEEAAFSLPPGGLSGVVESAFGFHIIRVERTRGRSEVQASHILIMPEIGSAEVERARDLALEIVRKARGGESMVDLYDEYSDPLVPDSLTLAFDQLSEFPPAYVALRTASSGDVVGPLEYNGGQGNAQDVRFAVVKVLEVREAGAYTFEDLRPQLARQLQEEKQREKILEDLRARTYIQIRM